jgi:hypothetical protein
MIKAGNVLCSGPRRRSYVPNELPSIGCNFLWTDAQWTIIKHPIVIHTLLKSPDIMPEHTRLIVEYECLRHLKDDGVYDQIKHRIHSIFKYKGMISRSTGHNAAEWMIQQGFNYLNIYGCDNWFGDVTCTDNWAHCNDNPNKVYNENLIMGYSKDEIDHLTTRGHNWKTAWVYLINKYTGVTFNFVP